MDWVTSQVSQNTPFSLTITLPILSEQWYNLAYILFLYKVKLSNMDYSSCSVWLDMCCFTFWSALLARKSVRPDFETIFRPVKIGLRRTSPPSPPLCAALKSTLVQVVAWCRQAASHYLSQCWPESVSPYGLNWVDFVRTRFKLWLQSLIKNANMFLIWPIVA